MDRFLAGGVFQQMVGSAPAKRPAPSPAPAKASAVAGQAADDIAIVADTTTGSAAKKMKLHKEDSIAAAGGRESLMCVGQPQQAGQAAEGGTLAKADSKKEYVLTDTDLKKLPSTKVGARLHYQRSDLVAASHRKHGGKEGLAKARANAKLFATKVDGKTLEQHRRTMGDAVSSCISVQKWCVAARTHCVVECHPDVFRGLVMPNSISVVPADFSKDTPVVVALATKGASTIFGSTKLTGGTRMGSWTANQMQLIYTPSTQKMSCWWTMDGY